jgi:hypothetical protein
MVQAFPALPDDGAGKTPSGWRSAVVGDGPDSIVCHSPGSDGLLDLPVPPSADFQAGVRVRPEPGGQESVGLAFRVVGADRYYVARANSRNNNLRLYRRDGAQWSLLAARDLAVPVGQWHELTVRARGPQFVVGLDREPILEVNDNTLRTGRLAVWAESTTSACFEQFWVIDEREPGAWDGRFG